MTNSQNPVGHKYDVLHELMSLDYVLLKLLVLFTSNLKITRSSSIGGFKVFFTNTRISLILGRNCRLLRNAGAKESTLHRQSLVVQLIRYSFPYLILNKDKKAVIPTLSFHTCCLSDLCLEIGAMSEQLLIHC